MEVIQPQHDNKIIPIIAECSLTPRSNRSSLSGSFNEEVNEVVQCEIVNSVTNSEYVNITNNSSNIFNGSIVINKIYPQCETLEPLPEETPTVLENSRLKRFCSAFCSEVQQRCSKKSYIAIPVLLLILLVLIVEFIMWLFDSAQLHLSHSGTTSNTTSNNSDLLIVSRNEWGAKPPKTEAVFLSSLPPSLVIISHTESTLCYILKQCVIFVQRIQSYHMDDQGWNDIGYNFLVGGDGLVYEGRGWNIAASHTRGYNSWSRGKRG